MNSRRDEQRAFRRAVGDQTGTIIFRPRTWREDLVAQDAINEMFKLATEARGFASLTVDSYLSADFGKEIFVPGLSVPGDGSVFYPLT